MANIHEPDRMGIQYLHPDAQTPTKKEGDAGYDLYAVENAIVYHDSITKVRTGVAMSIPDGVVGLIMDRSGLSINEGISKVAGVIDPSYRGEIIVGLHKATDEVQYQLEFDWNDGEDCDRGVQGIEKTDTDYVINKGDRIAQIVFVKFEEYEFVEQELTETERGNKGFGSSGS